MEKLKKEQYYLVAGLIAGAYISIFYDIIKYLIGEYFFTDWKVRHLDPTVPIFAIAGMLSIAIGLISLWALLRGKFEKKPTD